jgi:ligand-binding sensor domain-containing protein
MQFIYNNYNIIIINRLNTVIAVVLLFVFQSRLHAQSDDLDYGVQRITTEIQKTMPGISQNTIRCIYEDHKGLLWFGTWDGLNRYDGIRFDIVRMKVGDTKTSLSNNTINAINQDQQKNIWVATDGGINCLRYSDLKRENLNLSKKYPILNDTIHAILVDETDRVWVGSQNGLVIINSQKDSLIKLSDIINNETELDYIEIRQIVQFEKNIIWIGTANGLYKLSTIDGDLDHFSKPNISDNHITFIENYSDSILCIGTENGLNILNLNSDTIRRLFPFSKTATDIGENVFLSGLLYNDKEFLFGISIHGLVKYNFINDEFNAFTLPNIGKENTDIFNPQDEDIACMKKDKFNNLWLGTAWNGFLCISPEPILFQKFGASKEGFNDIHIWAFYYNNNELWVGTEKGVNIYNDNTHKIRYLTQKNGLSSNRIRSIVKDKFGRMWVGTFDKGINIVDVDGSITHLQYKDSTSALPNNTIWNMLEDTSGYMWISTFSGLVKLDYVNFTSTFYRNNPKDNTSLSSNSVYNSSFDKLGRLWVSTYHGLNLFQPKTNNFKRYYHEEGNPASLSTNKIFKVYDDGEGYLWIATIGGGLNRLNLNSEEIDWFTTKDGLSNNIIYSLIDDGMGYLWLSSNLGINRFNKHTHIVNAYNVDDGLQSSEFNFGADMIDSNHNIYMGGMKGFNVFNPQKINNTDYKASLCVSDFYVNKVGDKYNVNFGDTVYLRPSLNSFEIKYTKLNLKNSTKELFRHKLINYESEWIKSNGSIAKATYTNVNPGKYVFSLQSANRFGVWNTKPYLLTIIVEEYWYRTYWFITAVIILLILIIVFIIRMRFERVKFKSEVEKQIYQLEKQSLRLQMNPHFVFNTLNSIQSYILNNEKEESISYLSKFSKLMRSILNNSSESIISLENEIDMLKHYIVLEQLRFDNGFDFDIIVDKHIDIEFVGIPGMLIQIYVENAIIHGLSPLKDRRGKLKISFSVKDNLLKCTIEDNGVGRDFHKNNSDRLHVSKGMLISKKRLEILNKTSSESPLIIEDLTDENGKALGTRVILIIEIEDIS